VSPQFFVCQSPNFYFGVLFQISRSFRRFFPAITNRVSQLYKIIPRTDGREQASQVRYAAYGESNTEFSKAEEQIL